jgi:hypothetical protein
MTSHLAARCSNAPECGETGAKCATLAGMASAAEALGLGCCPLSAIRNQAATISELLALPNHVFPLAGRVLGWPDAPAEISQHLPLSVTLRKATLQRGLRRERRQWLVRGQGPPILETRTQRFRQLYPQKGIPPGVSSFIPAPAWNCSIGLLYQLALIVTPRWSRNSETPPNQIFRRF